MVLFCVGCTVNNKIGGPSQTGVWEYAPEHIAIHPLSRFKNTEDDSIIIVHTTFTDGDGFACRGVGQLKITVKEDDIDESENVSLDNKDVNFKRFDQVTRTYRVHFSNVPNNWEKVTVEASFTNSLGEVLTSKPYVINR